MKYKNCWILAIVSVVSFNLVVARKARAGIVTNSSVAISKEAQNKIDSRPLLISQSLPTSLQQGKQYYDRGQLVKAAKIWQQAHHKWPKWPRQQERPSSITRRDK